MESKDVDGQKSIIWSDSSLQAVGYLRKIGGKKDNKKSKKRQKQPSKRWFFVFNMITFYILFPLLIQAFLGLFHM